MASVIVMALQCETEVHIGVRYATLGVRFTALGARFAALGVRFAALGVRCHSHQVLVGSIHTIFTIVWQQLNEESMACLLK